MPILLQQFLQQSQAKGSRSTVLTPLGWLLGIEISGLISAIYVHAPDSVMTLLSVAIGGTVILYLVAYVYFALTNSDALRSEKFTIQKLAIEHSAKGDNVIGLIDAENLPRLLPPADQNGGGNG